METITTFKPGIQERGEWFEFETAEGLRLSTKKGELVNQARQLLGQPVKVNYTERQSTNTNAYGQPYTNRYLESVESVQAGSATFTPHPGSNGSSNGQSIAYTTSDDRGAKAGRNNIAGAAVRVLIELSDGQPATIQRLLDGLARWSETGEPFLTTQQQTVAQPQFTGDDIPF